MNSGPSGEGRTRPNCAPAYYLGRPATVWLTVLSRRHRRSAASYGQLTRHPLLRTIPVPLPRPPQLAETAGGRGRVLVPSQPTPQRP